MVTFSRQTDTNKGLKYEQQYITNHHTEMLQKFHAEVYSTSLRREKSLIALSRLIYT
jgi:hypothetical protein